MCPFFTGNPRAVEPICSGCNTTCGYCGCARSDAARLGEAPCGQCPIRCGSRTDIAAWMRDVDGVAFDDIVLDVELPEELPRLIPQVDGGDLAGFDAELRWSAYAVGLRRVFSQPPRRPAVHRLHRPGSARAPERPASSAG